MFGLNKKSKQEKRDLYISYKQSFGGSAGKFVLYDLMNLFHMLNAHKGDPYSEGQRSVVLHILENTKVDLKEFDKLLSSESGEYEE